MHRYIRRKVNIYLYRLNSTQILKSIFISICLTFLIIQYVCITLYTWPELPPPIRTRLHPDRPITINLQPYSLCHPKDFHIENLTSYYHRVYSAEQQQPCFLIEDLSGGSWWSYVSQEFAEILSHLQILGIQSNIIYRSFPEHIPLTYRTNLKRYFLNACDMDENLPQEQQRPMVILLWNIDRLPWYPMRSQWKELLASTRTRLMVFIDDLHFTSQGIFNNRQYILQSAASEILSTYPYLFHNYYNDISPEKITWLPHSASLLSYRSINQTAENLLFVSGANLMDWYPCRSRAFFLCRTRKDLIACLKHPDYGVGMKNGSSFHYGASRYSSYMRQYVFGLGTCQSVHYAIAKLFEIPANGLVLVTTDDLVPILASLHLYADKHFLTVKCSSKEILADEIVRLKKFSKDNLLEIRKTSQDIIFERHLTKHRAELLHIRLLSQALMVSSTSAEQRTLWEQWGRNCQE